MYKQAPFLTISFPSWFVRLFEELCLLLMISFVIHSLSCSASPKVISLSIPYTYNNSTITVVNDNDDLSKRASALLVRMCGVVPPRELIDPLIDAIFEAIRSSHSWRVRLKALPLLQSELLSRFFFHTRWDCPSDDRVRQSSTSVRFH